MIFLISKIDFKVFYFVDFNVIFFNAVDFLCGKLLYDRLYFFLVVYFDFYVNDCKNRPLSPVGDGGRFSHFTTYPKIREEENFVGALLV